MKNAATLKGVFPEPSKGPPKRDFLRENKTNLRTLQKLRAQEQNEFQPACDYRLGGRNSAQGPKSTSRRSYSSSRRINSGCSCISKKSQYSVSSSNPVHSVSRSDKGIQTDDICDEIFLSNALQRCVSRSSEKIISPENASNDENFNIPVSAINSTNDDNLLDTLGNLKLNLNDAPPSEDFVYPSAQSSKMSLSSQNKQPYVPDSGNRKKVKIPKYLEREKREKELQRIKEMERDPHCPDGHYALSEKERKDALESAEKQFRSLVDELNRMPMTTETIRIRTRKMEIEKALIDLEHSIRLFSKQKVYVKIDE